MILANGFFVAAEFAVVAVDRSRVEVDAEAGQKRAVSLMKALRTLSFQLSGAQLGITITSLVVGFIAEPTLGEALKPLFEELPLVGGKAAAGASLVAALLIATALQMVYGELVPKNLAIAKPEPVAYAVATPFRIVNTIFRPLILALNATANRVVRLFGIEPRDELEMARSLEELELLIRSSGEGGALLEEEFSLLRRSVSFGGKTADDSLRPRVAMKALPDTATIGDMKQLALETGFSRFPVYRTDLDDIVGIAHVKDSLAIPIETREVTPISAILQEAPIFPETRDLESLLLELRRKHKHMAIIVDEYGGTAGLITIEDLIEEIVGEIEDEYDPDEASARVTTPLTGTHVLSGLLHPDEVEEISGFQVPGGDYETLAGFMLARFERIPSVGDQLAFDGWELKVVEMERNRISEVLLVSPTEAKEP